MGEFRHEWKHEITRSDMIAIRRRLQAVAQPDPHAVNGRYLIRSLYFDTPSDSALREKLDGVSRREKFRIRLYNHDPATLRLEKKSKRGSLSSKETVPLTAAETLDIVHGRTGWMAEDPRPLVRELYFRMQTKLLRPAAIVDYVREPFVYAPGNVRVTLDYDIRTGLRCTDLLDPRCVTVPAGDAPVILEVKWDAYLPEIIRMCVQLPGRRTSAFSKYAASRIYG